ncbi:MAG: glycosyltransferase family 4 protein [Solibacillus sp.]
MDKIWIIAPFTSIETGDCRNRFLFLANMLYENGKDVTLFTSNYSHQFKSHLEDLDKLKRKFKFKIVYVEELGYDKNVSLKRVFSHISFSRKLKQYYKNHPQPDLIYCAYPTMSAALVSGKYAEINKIPFIIDVQDTWPESISSAIDINKLHIKMLMMPFTILANSIYKKANIIIGVSETYAQRAKVKGSKAKEFITVYIGADLKVFDSIENIEVVKSEDEIWLSYIGTLSHSYDLETAIKSMSHFLNNKKLKLMIMGYGPDYEKLNNLALSLGVLNKNVFFTGMLEYKEMINRLRKSDIALNAITKNAKQTFTNKLGDYLSAGLPILNSCREKEIVEFIEKEKVGYNYEAENVEDLIRVIHLALLNLDEFKEMGINSRCIAEEKFDRNKSYNIIMSEIEKSL